MPLEVTLSPAALPMLAVAIAIFALGIFVVGREGTSLVSISFLGLTLGVTIWLTAAAAAASVADESVAFALSRFSYVGVTVIPPLVLQFTAALMGAVRRLRWWLAASWISALGFLAVFTTGRLMLAGMWRYSWGYYGRLTAISAVFLAFFGLVLAGSLFLLARARPHSAQERRRDRAFFVALAIGYLGCIDYLPSFGVAILPIGCLAVLGFIALAARSIVRFRLTDLSASSIADELLETMHGGVVVVDARNEVRIVNQAAAKLLGWSAGASRRDDELRALLGIAPRAAEEAADATWPRRQTLAAWARADGSAADLAIAASAIHDGNGELVGTLFTLNDVTDRRRAEEHEYGATHDLLTGLANRARFMARFAAERDAILAAGRVPALLFLDLDGFKSVNDLHGHQTGDALLKLAATRIRNSMRAEDLVARWAGDEFVILAGLAREEDVAVVGSKLVRVVSEPFSIGDRRLAIGASIGAAFYPLDGCTCDELVHTADAAMYAAKRAGKGRLNVRNDVAAPPAYEIRAEA